MIKYERQENGVKVSLEIENESYTGEEVLKLIEQINTTVEIKELKSLDKNFFNRDTKGED